MTGTPSASRSPSRRVLLLSDAYWNPHGGTEGQMRSLVENLPPPWQAELWTAHHSQWLDDHPFPCPTRWLRLGPLSRPWTHLRVRGLARLVRSRFDLIQTFMGDSSVLGPLLSRASGVPVLVSRRDLGFWHTPSVVAALRRTARIADGFVANAEAVKRHVVETEHVPPQDVAVVHNGHPLDAFDGPRSPGLRAAHGIPSDADVVVLLANIKPLKRQMDLVDALGRIAPRHPRVHVVLLGLGPEEELWSTARRLGVEERLTIHHAQGGAIDFLKESTVGVLCSETEGLSNAILEYMACGLPVVATDVGGNPDLVEHGVNGLLYECGDVESLAAHLHRLLTDPALRERMGTASRERFRSRFGLERMVSETIAVYERTIARLPVGVADETRASGGAGGSERIAVEAIDDVERLAALAEPWRALLGRDAFFLSPEWVLTWLRWKGSAARLHALVARDPRGVLIGLLPLVRRGQVLSIAGASEGADHLDVVGGAACAQEVADAFLDHLLCEPRSSWTRLDLRHLAEDGALRYAVRRRRWRLPYRERLATVCPFVAATGTFDDYMKRFSSKHRGNLRRQARAVREDATAGVRRVVDPGEAAAAIDVVFDLHERRFATRGRSTAFAGSVRSFHRALAPALAAKGELALTVLSVAERPVAALYGFRFGGKLLHFQGGFDPDASSKSPGTALTTIVLEDDVFRGGLTEYDFLDGDEPYKFAFATGVRRLFDVVVAREGPLHRAATVIVGLAKAVASTRRRNG